MSESVAVQLGSQPPVPMALRSAAARDLALGATQPVAAALRRLLGRPATAVFGVVAVAWLINASDWSRGDARVLVAMSLGSLVATTTLSVGWASEPVALEKWAAWAVCASVASAIPLISL